MVTTAFVALIIKDFRLKIFNLGLLWAFLVSGSLALSLLSGIVGQMPLLLFPLLMTAFLSLFYIDWLISNEKEGGTFTWLRTLPLSDMVIITSKMVTLGIMLAIHPLAVLPSAIIEPINGLAAGITAIVAVVMFCGSIWGMLFFLVFRGANRYVIPLFVILLLSLTALILMQRLPWLQDFLVGLPYSTPLAGFILPIAAFLGWWLACRIFSSLDSADLVD